MLSYCENLLLLQLFLPASSRCVCHSYQETSYLSLQESQLFGPSEETINMKISIFAGVLLLSAAVISVDVLSVDGEETPVEKFKRQHIYQNMAPNRCQAVITERDIKDVKTNKCKEKNTFIDASYDKVKKVCGDEGEPIKIGNKILRISRENFNFRVVDCKCNENNYFPKCDCSGSSGNKRIVIDCDQNKNPDHYERSYPITIIMNEL
ncbi:ribonuclease pancreatic gamma-type-like isoform X2 [Sander lucioperca]|uniref:ribonuclease pancreatic gamma-type-like isoform X2 n=1 Tax=Sander lucioperca TaxID=283035 RepID=UPI001653DC66|nr:ribonuclease pancreatic gamma-type-like isoform X2 [Sander lucioperca]